MPLSPPMMKVAGSLFPERMPDCSPPASVRLGCLSRSDWHILRTRAVGLRPRESDILIDPWRAAALVFSRSCPMLAYPLSRSRSWSDTAARQSRSSYTRHQLRPVIQTGATVTDQLFSVSRSQELDKQRRTGDPWIRELYGAG
jgi:hypothetical protein